MAVVPTVAKINDPENSANPDRRSFIKGAAAAGLLSAVAMTPVCRVRVGCTSRTGDRKPGWAGRGKSS